MRALTNLYRPLLQEQKMGVQEEWRKGISSTQKHVYVYVYVYVYLYTHYVCFSSFLSPGNLHDSLDILWQPLRKSDNLCGSLAKPSQVYERKGLNMM